MDALKRIWAQPLVRLFVKHAAVGFLASAVFVGVLFYFDLGGIGRLLAKWPGFILLLWFFVGLTFGGLHIAVAVMGLTDKDEG